MNIAGTLERGLNNLRTVAHSDHVAGAAALWSAVPEDVAERLIEEFPELIGNQDGVPFAVRARANLIRMTRDRDSLRAESVELWNSARQLLDSDKAARLLALDGLLSPLAPRADPDTGAVVAPAGPRTFVRYDPMHLGRLVEIDGDLARCEFVAILVPGMLNNLNRFEQLAVSARRVRDAAGPGVTTAVAWLGYEPPDGADGILTRKARAAGEDMKSFMYALERESPTARKTVLAHSYGTVVTRFAFEGGEPPIDAVHMAGSPGLGKGIKSAEQLGFRTRDGRRAPLFVSRASDDPVSLLQPHQHDPFEFDDVFLASSEGGGERVVGHTHYYQLNTQSLHNMAHIVRGDIQAIPRHMSLQPTKSKMSSAGKVIGPGASVLRSLDGKVADGHRKRQKAKDFNDPRDPKNRQLRP